jgi:transposase IS66 family protein
VLSSTKLFADDTTLPVLDPGRGRTKTGRLWTSYRWSSIQSLGLQAFLPIGIGGAFPPAERSTVLALSRTLRAGARAGAASRHPGQRLRAALLRQKVGTEGCRLQPNKGMAVAYAVAGLL